MALADWVTFRVPRGPTRVKLFCFPYAGCGASMYRRWPELLGPDVDVLAMQPPGRETRCEEPAMTVLDDLIEGALHGLEPRLGHRNVFFGFSLGGLVAFELARALRRRGVVIDHLIVAASPAPHLSRRGSRAALGDEELVHSLKVLGGTPRDVLASREMMSFYLPIVRADFELIERYRYRPEPPLSCPITGVAGTQDAEVSLAEVRAWRGQTGKQFEMVTLEGGHFFIHDRARDLARLVARVAAEPLQIASIS